MRLLVVEDDPVLADALTSALRTAGFAVDCVMTGSEADLVLATEMFDLVILDVELPGLDGFEVLHRMRRRKSKVPVLVLTARDAVFDRIHGLNLGADDYLTKPFAMGELEARARALIRRAAGSADNVIQVGSLTVNLQYPIAAVNQVPLDLPARELAVLRLLASRAGKVVSKEALMQSLYTWDEEVGPNAIEIHVHRLRKKLQDSDISIRTARGLGYLLECASAEAVQSHDDD